MNERRGENLTVVKVGGSLVAHPRQLEHVLRVIGGAAERAALVVVPGGGPFADAVRAVDRELGLGDDAAHWMAVLAMDQYAHLLAERLPRAEIAAFPSEVAASLAGVRLPVLAPYAWLRRVDPLPHAWGVTSDSIAAWAAGALAARRVILVKAPGTSGGSTLADPYFVRTLTPGTTHEIVAADAVERLDELLLGTER